MSQVLITYINRCETIGQVVKLGEIFFHFRVEKGLLCKAQKTERKGTKIKSDPEQVQILNIDNILLAIKMNAF